MDLGTALRLNGLFSFGTGALLALAPATVGTWLGVSVDGWLRLLGVALIGHGALLTWAAAREGVAAWAKANLAVIAPYPLLMVVLVAGGAIGRTLGQALALADGGMVGLLAVAHWSALRATPAVAQLEKA